MDLFISIKVILTSEVFEHADVTELEHSMVLILRKMVVNTYKDLISTVTMLWYSQMLKVPENIETRDPFSSHSRRAETDR